MNSSADFALSSDDLALHFQAKVLQSGNKKILINYLLTDSRKLKIPEKTIFFAITGKPNNGHDYIDELYQKGVRVFVVEQEVEVSKYNGANFFLAFSSIRLLQDIVAFKRKTFSLPVVGITGSNGKTIVKEWLSQLLNSKFYVCKNPKSFNSQIGVPLSVWELSSHHQIGVFEAGISQPNEMQALAEVIQPTIGIFTNIGPAHQEGFSSLKQKIEEKLKLFEKVEKLFVCNSYTHIQKVIAEKPLLQKKVCNWDYTVLKTENGRSRVRLSVDEVVLDYVFPFTDAASIENCAIAAIVAQYLGISTKQCQEGVRALKPLNMRLEVKKAQRSSYLIDDSYSNDLASLSLALDLFKEKRDKLGVKSLIILSEIIESGLDQKFLNQKVADLLNSAEPDEIWLVGENVFQSRSLLKSKTQLFHNTEEVVNHLSFAPLSNALILLKGARKFSFEKIVALLQEQSHGTQLEISLDALANNLSFYRSILPKDVKLMVMVKAFAYGTGGMEVAELLQFHRVDYLAVAYTDEGIKLRQSGVKVPIMVMNPEVDTYRYLFKYKLEPVVSSWLKLQFLINFVKNEKQQLKIHVEFDTGMNRLGFSIVDVNEVFNQIKANESALSVASVFSHLSSADSTSSEDIKFTNQQIEHFKRVVDLANSIIKKPFLAHILNSGGIVSYPQGAFDMVRLGIGLYGYEPNLKWQNHLQPVHRLVTRVAQVREIDQLEPVGYGRSFVANQRMKIATISIGYADGFDRRLSNGVGKVYYNNQPCPVVGRVCMDMTMIDVTGLNVKEGDEVVVFETVQHIVEMAKSLNTIPYEIMTKISERVKRVYYSG